MGRIKNIPPNMASSSRATTCLVHPMSYKATLKLSPQKKDLVENVKYRCFFIKKIFATMPKQTRSQSQRNKANHISHDIPEDLNKLYVKKLRFMQKSLTQARWETTSTHQSIGESNGEPCPRSKYWRHSCHDKSPAVWDCLYLLRIPAPRGT